jgi:hypothetical protein
VEWNPSDFVLFPPAAAIAFQETKLKNDFVTSQENYFLLRDERNEESERGGSLMMTLSILLDALRMSLR